MDHVSSSEDEVTASRRVSTLSAGSDDDGENPLMKLVNAASMLHPTLQCTTSTTSTKVEENIMESSCSSSLSSQDDSKGKDSNDGKVVIGTKADLFGPSKKTTFAEQLHAILEDESNSNVLAWMPDGEAFTIVNPRLFAIDHMPKLFNIRNMSSFVRKLSRWGFTRVHEKSTRNSDIFKHKSFRRGRKDLVKRIRCVYRPSLKPEESIPAVISPGVSVGTHRSKDEKAYTLNFAQERRRSSYHPNSIRASSHARTAPHLKDDRYASASIYCGTLPPTLVEQRSLGNVKSDAVSAALETLRRETRADQRLHPDLLALRSAQEMIARSRSQSLLANSIVSPSRSDVATTTMGRGSTGQLSPQTHGHHHSHSWSLARGHPY